MVKSGEKQKSRIPGKRIAALSLGLNVLFFLGKYLLYRFTGSTAVLAEAVHSLTDVVGCALVFMGIVLAEKKSERFPWGLYKVENIAAALSAVLIFFSGYEIAVMAFRPPEAMQNLDVGVLLMLSLAGPIVLFSRYESATARQVNSPSLLADAENWKMDLAPLAVVVAGMAGARLSYPFADRIAASIVLVLVIRAGYGILRDSVKSLLDMSADKPALDRIQGIIQGFDQVKEVVDLNARNSGRFIFVSAVVRLVAKRLHEAHDIADALEREIRNQVPFVERVMIHYEPEKKAYKRHAVPLSAREGDISEHFAKAPFIALWDKRPDGTASAPEILENAFLNLEKGGGIRLAEFLVKKGADVLYTKEDFKGKGPEYVFAGAEVEVRKTDLKNLKEMMESEKEQGRATGEGKA